MKTLILSPELNNLTLAAQAIKRGELVAIPTETVYGLAAHALNETAVKKIYGVKGRASDNPLIVHLSSVSEIEGVAYLNAEYAQILNKFMPGALTVVLKRKQCVPDVVTAGLDTVAVRVPMHSVARKFIGMCDVPLAAPSANLSSSPSPTTAMHVYNDLNGKIEYIIDGGKCDIGIESTILDLSGQRVRLLRHGGVALEDLEQAFGAIEIVEHNGVALSPGMKYRHYAPKATVILCKREQIEQEYDRLLSQNKTPLIISFSQFKDGVVVSDNNDYAHRLFYELRLADEQGYSHIICEYAHNYGIGVSVNERLKKAAQGE